MVGCVAAPRFRATAALPRSPPPPTPYPLPPLLPLALLPLLLAASAQTIAHKKTTQQGGENAVTSARTTSRTSVAHIVKHNVAHSVAHSVRYNIKHSVENNVTNIVMYNVAHSGGNIGRGTSYKSDVVLYGVRYVVRTIVPVVHCCSGTTVMLTMLHRQCSWTLYEAAVTS